LKLVAFLQWEEIGGQSGAQKLSSCPSSRTWGSFRPLVVFLTISPALMGQPRFAVAVGQKLLTLDAKLFIVNIKKLRLFLKMI
jgi:hypothetical protein